MKKNKTKRPEPVMVKTLSFQEMIEEVRRKSREAQAKFEKDGLCQSKDCTNKGNITENGYLCDVHNEEAKKLLAELSNSPGFMRL